MSTRPEVVDDVIGREIGALPTPTLLLDRAALERNVAAMAEFARGTVDVRPHAKIHKCVEIARLQLAAGAIGSTAATVFEAAGLVRGGIPEVLIANEVVAGDALALVAQLAGEAALIVAVDDVRGVDLLSRAAAAAGTEVGVLVDVDVGMGRGGVRSADEARAVAERAAAAPGVVVRGAMGYEGHAVLERDRARRRALVEEAMATLMRHVELLRGDGHDVAIVSAGGTNTYDLTGPVAGVTELQAGTYALMDTAYVAFAPRFEPALGVAGRVVSRHGDRVVLDAGSKTVGVPELEQPRPRDPRLALVALHEEHALLDVVEGAGPALGDVVELVVGYCGGAVNAHDAYVVVADGVAVDVWPIVGRGPGRVPR
jgi:D-serine deaminase-like pyridoxal phosphate-dependent protein